MSWKGSASKHGKYSGGVLCCSGREAAGDTSGKGIAMMTGIFSASRFATSAAQHAEPGAICGRTIVLAKKWKNEPNDFQVSQ
jgi:hypothetical protein